MCMNFICQSLLKVKSATSSKSRSSSVPAGRRQIFAAPKPPAGKHLCFNETTLCHSFKSMTDLCIAFCI